MWGSNSNVAGWVSVFQGIIVPTFSGFKWTAFSLRWRYYSSLKLQEPPTECHSVTSHKTRIPIIYRSKNQTDSAKVIVLFTLSECNSIHKAFFFCNICTFHSLCCAYSLAGNNFLKVFFVLLSLWSGSFKNRPLKYPLSFRNKQTMYEVKLGEYDACFNCGICFVGQNLLLNCCVKWHM